MDYWTRLNPTIMAGLSSEELMHANQNRTISVFAVCDRGPGGPVADGGAEAIPAPPLFR
jgi:hypothetical protein